MRSDGVVCGRLFCPGFHQAAAEAARREEELKAEETENQAESSETKSIKKSRSPWLKQQFQVLNE